MRGVDLSAAPALGMQMGQTLANLPLQTQQAQLGALKIGQEKQAMEKSAMMDSILSQAGGDLNAAIDLARQQDPRMALEFQKMYVDQMFKQSQLQKEQALTRKAIIDADFATAEKMSALEKEGWETEVIRAKLASLPMETSKEKMKVEQELRKEFTSHPSVKTYYEAKTHHNNIVSSFKKDKEGNPNFAKGSAMGDLALIFSFMKMLDPTSVVRESEQGMVIDAKPFVEKMTEGWLNRLATGEMLTESQRRDIYNQALGYLQPRENEFNQFRGQLKRSVDDFGLDEQRTLGAPADTAVTTLPANAQAAMKRGVILNNKALNLKKTPSREDILTDAKKGGVSRESLNKVLQHYGYEIEETPFVNVPPITTR